MISDRKVCLIDTGRNGDGEKIDELISSEGWEIEYIINAIKNPITVKTANSASVVSIVYTVIAKRYISFFFLL